MSFIELILIAIGVSMDAFAVSISKGLCLQTSSLRCMTTAGLYFGLFQAGMPLIGYYLYGGLESAITEVDHWIAFVLLVAIGTNMLIEAGKKGEGENASFSFRYMLPLAIATSIDALAVGITLGALGTNIYYAIFVIGVTTFLFSFFGVKIGCIFGNKYESKAKIIGGLILICIGIKILLEHLKLL